MLILAATSTAPDAVQHAVASLSAQQRTDDARVAAESLVMISAALLRAAGHMQPEATYQVLAGILEQLEALRRLQQMPPDQAH